MHSGFESSWGRARLPCVGRVTGSSACRRAQLALDARRKGTGFRSRRCRFESCRERAGWCSSAREAHNLRDQCDSGDRNQRSEALWLSARLIRGWSEFDSRRCDRVNVATSPQGPSRSRSTSRHDGQAARLITGLRGTRRTPLSKVVRWSAMMRASGCSSASRAPVWGTGGRGGGTHHPDFPGYSEAVSRSVRDGEIASSILATPIDRQAAEMVAERRGPAVHRLRRASWRSPTHDEPAGDGSGPTHRPLTGSIPVSCMCRGGGDGRRAPFRPVCPRGRAGSSPVLGTFRGRGGAGRRARLRAVWGKPRGGSNPLDRMLLSDTNPRGCRNR